MPEFDRKVAVEAACENKELQERLELLEENKDVQDDGQKALEKPSVKADRIRQRNEELKNEVKQLRSEYAELRRVNVNELYRNFTYTSTKLASLQNENMSLRAVLRNQKQGVESATRAFQEHQELRRQNDLNNSHTKEDIQMMKERREELITECDGIRKEKSKLENQLDELIQVGKNSAVTLKKLQKEIKSVVREIQTLESEIKGMEVENATVAEESEENDEDLDDLREEFKELKEELQHVKKNQGLRP